MNVEILTKAVNDLKAGRAVMENSQGLARKVEARDASNREVDPFSVDAVKFDPCAALDRAGRVL